MDNPINILINKYDIEDILNYFGNIGENGSKLHINNLEPYRIAFTHESYYQSIQKKLTSPENTSDTIFLDYFPHESNERLEFLGDHILKAIMGRYLYERFPNEREGFLTTLKIKIEKGKMLHKIGMIMGFKKFILLSLQVENQTLLDSIIGRNTPSYYEDCFEAFVGAIFEDFGESGYIYADRFVRNVIENIIDFSELNSTNDNFKDILQRYYQSFKWKTPVYNSLTKEGPVYRVIFTRILLFSEEQMNTLSNIVKHKIIKYNNDLLKYYKELNDGTYEKIIELKGNTMYVLGVGIGRKITDSEQECAKECIKNLDLDV
jgi:dsRNA-specific ribonuclease